MVGPKPTRSLQGKSIYLDLFGYRNVAEFEKNLQLLGAVVEKCFSKEVSHVITNRATAINSQTRSAPKNVTAEAAIASPLSLSPFADSGGVQSPFAVSPTTADAVGRPMTRGQAIVEKAMLSRKRGSTNVVECAQQWNIKVIHIDAAVKWMKKELRALDAQKQEKKSKVMQLTRPYMKFEESRCRFCPEFKILAGFPSLEFNGPRRTCPFDQFAQPCSVENAGNQAEISSHQKTSAYLASEAEHHQIKADAKLSAKLKRKKPDKEKRQFIDKPDVAVLSSKDDKLMTAGELQKLKNHRIDAARQKGFCEICDVKYDNMLQHLRTEKHMSYVEDVGNYETLDKLINQIHEQTIFQMNDPMNKLPKVMAPSSTVSSEADEYDVNLLTMPSSSLSSHLKIKVTPEWSNSCSAFFQSDSNREVEAASNTFQQNTTNLLPKHKATADETEPKEPGINDCAVENTTNRNDPLEKHSGLNEHKSSDDITSCASFDQNAVNGERNVDSPGDLGDYRRENLTTSKANNTLRPDNSVLGKLESGASFTMNAESMSSLACLTQQSDNSELDSEEVSSEIPVIQSVRHSKQTCKMYSEGMHVSVEPPIAQPITFTQEGYMMNSEVTTSEFPVLQSPNCTDQLKLQSQMSCHTSVTHSPSKCRKRCHSNSTDSPLQCPNLPLPEVVRFHQESLRSVAKCFLDGYKSHKRKRIKFSRAMSVLTNRSVLELFDSDTSSNFEGFTEVNEQVVADLSYDEISEAELSIDSDFDWASTSSDSRLDSNSSAFPKNPTASIAPIITSVSKDCTLSEANLNMAHDSETPMTDSNSNQNVLTILDLSKIESDSDFYLPRNASLNPYGVFNCFKNDTTASFTDDYESLCTSQQEDILTYLDKDESDLLVKPVTSNETCSSLSITKDESGLNQLSVDNKSSSVIAADVKLNQVPANVKLALTNARNTWSRSWQPVVSLKKCDDWERGSDGDKEEQMSVSGSHSAVEDELLTECSSGIMKSLPSENMSVSSMSNIDVLRSRVEMPEATNVVDLVDLESDAEIKVEDVLANDIPNVKSTNAKNTGCRSWQPVVSLKKCDDWERGSDGDMEERMSVSGSHSAVEDEVLTGGSSEVYSLVEASNGFHKLTRKLNFSLVNEGHPSGLDEKKSWRKQAKCSSGVVKSLPSENTSASSMSNIDVLCSRVEMPEATNVVDMIDLKSNGEINVEEVLANEIPIDEQKPCSESSTVNHSDRNSVASHFSGMTVKHDTHSTFNKGDHVQTICSDCTAASGIITAVKSDKTDSHDVINVSEIPIQTNGFAPISSEVRNAIVACNLRTKELMRTDQDFSEKDADSNVMGKMHFNFCYDKIRNNKMWQPVVMLDRSSVKPNIPCPRQPNVSISGRSDAEHVAKMPSIQNGMISFIPLSSFHSAFILADALGSEIPFARNEEVLSDKGKISRSLVVLLNRCDSQLTDSCVDVSIQKMPPSKPGLLEKQNLIDIRSHDGCLVNTISLINHRKDVNVAVDLNQNSNTCQLCECEVKDVGTLDCEHGASEKFTVRICRSRTFENSNHVHSSIGVNAKKKLTNANVNLRNTIDTDAVSGCAEEPLEALRSSLPNSVLMRISDVEIVSSDNGQSGNINSESSDMSNSQKVRRSIYSQLNRSLSRKYLDWSKPETYEASINAKLQWTSKTNPTECLDLSKKNPGSLFPNRRRSFNHFLPRSKADWSKTLSPEGKNNSED